MSLDDLRAHVNFHLEFTDISTVVSLDDYKVTIPVNLHNLTQKEGDSKYADAQLELLKLILEDNDAK